MREECEIYSVVFVTNDNLFSFNALATVAALSLYSCGDVCSCESILCQLPRSRAHGASDGKLVVRFALSLLKSVSLTFFHQG